jgi:hypothetical protein
MTWRAFLQSARFGGSRPCNSFLTDSDVGRNHAKSRRRIGVIRATRNGVPFFDSSDQVPTTTCRLRVPDATPEPQARGEPATPASSTWAFPPLSARCKFNLFLTTTYSPYTFLGVFRRLWIKPRGNGRTTVVECKVGGSDLELLWRTWNRAGLSRPLLGRRSCARILDTSPRTGELSWRGVGMPQPEL